jgi:ABC-type uncharacterized transport system substrate-binding protein
MNTMPPFNHALSPFFGAILFLVFVSIGAAYIVWAKLAGAPGILVTVIPLGLMLVYALTLGFARYFRLRDDQAGDNLYYLGFLYTLTSLGVSLWQFSVNQGAEGIVTNFGIAIASTILGVALRVVFNQMRQDPIEVERTARLELADAARRVKQELDGTAFEFASFRRATQQMSEEALAETRERATRTIPIVMARVGDPVAYGLVTSLARPGGNATGVSVFTHELAEKRLEVLKDAVPGLSRVGSLYEPNFPPGEIELKQFMAAAPALKLQIQAIGVRNLAALEGPPADIMNESPQALFVGSSLLFEMHPQQTVGFAFKSRLPALYVRRRFAEIGGIISYGIAYRDTYRTAADYIARILGGEKPGDLPVQLPVKIELVVNLKTARALDVIIPPLRLARADEVIE